MTAVSPYAPARRRPPPPSSSFSSSLQSRSSTRLIRRASSSYSVASATHLSDVSSARIATTGNITLLCLVLRYWDRVVPTLPLVRHARDILSRWKDVCLRVLLDRHFRRHSQRRRRQRRRRRRGNEDDADVDDEQDDDEQDVCDESDGSPMIQAGRLARVVAEEMASAVRWARLWLRHVRRWRFRWLFVPLLKPSSSSTSLAKAKATEDPRDATVESGGGRIAEQRRRVPSPEDDGSGGGRVCAGYDNGRAVVVVASSSSSSSSLSSSPPSDGATREGRRIRRNLVLIESILSYWFSRYTPDVAQKSLWMIASSSVERLEVVDADVHDRFGHVISELVATTGLKENINTTKKTASESSAEGNGGGDKIELGNGLGAEWCRDIELYGWRGKLAFVVALDQMARHVRRHVSRLDGMSGSAKEATAKIMTTTTTTKTSTRSVDDSPIRRSSLVRLPDQSVLDALSLTAARSIQTDHASDLSSGSVPLPMQVFALMPFRHASTLASVSFVREAVDRLASVHAEEDGTIRRFRRATNRRMAVLQDEARRVGGMVEAAAAAVDDDGNRWKEREEGIDVGDFGSDDARNGISTSMSSPGFFADEDILEVAPFDADMSNASDHPVVRTIVTFLAGRGVVPASYAELASTKDKSAGVHSARGGKKKKKKIFAMAKARQGTVDSGMQNRVRKEEPHLGGEGENENEEQQAAGGGGEGEGEEKVGKAVASEEREKQTAAIGEGGASGTASHSSPLPTLARRNFIVSLSGGVDSMVIAHVLSHLRSDLGYPHLSLSAVHVDYGNRPESYAEAAFVIRYAKERLGVANVVVRRIEDNVRRGVTDRDEYERKSRTARYELYRETARKMTSASASAMVATFSSSPLSFSSYDDETSHDPREVGVMLGHHRGDLRENVLSNAHRGSGPLDLSGMTPTSVNDGVLLCRPLLPLEKSDVFDYAHRYGVPYFRDTTPRWSTRGKLRNRLLPLLEEIYGEGSMSNLTKLAEESDMASILVQSSLIRPFLDGVRMHPMGLSFDTVPFRGRPIYFWKLALRDALHSAGRGMFGDGSVASFLERVDPMSSGSSGNPTRSIVIKKKEEEGGGNGQADDVRPGWLQMRRDYAVYLRSDGRVFAFHPESFPWRKADQYRCVGDALEWEGDDVPPEKKKKEATTMVASATTEVGPWTITADALYSLESVDDDDVVVKARELLSQPAMRSWEELMGGNVRYHLCAPLRPFLRPLRFVSEYKRATRPSAWKNCLDLKVERTLPLLGLDEEAQRSLDEMEMDRCEYGRDWCVVRVLMRLNRIEPS